MTINQIQIELKIFLLVLQAGSSTKLMLTTEISGKSTHYNQVFAMQRFLISLRKEAMKKKTRLCCICSTISFSEKIIDVSVLVCQLF